MTMPRGWTRRVKPSNVQQTTVFSHMLARSAQLRKSTQPETTPRERTQHVTVRRMTPVERATFSMGVITREGRLRARTTSAFARIQIVRRKRHMRVGSVNDGSEQEWFRGTVQFSVFLLLGEPMTMENESGV